MLLTTDSMKLSLCSSTSPPPALASWLTRPVRKSGSVAARASMRSTFPVASSGWSGPIFRTFSDLETFNRGPRCVRSSRGSSTPATSCGVRLYSESVTDFPAAICVAPCAQPHMGVNMTASHHGQVGKITQKLHFVWAKIVLCMGLFFVFFGRSDHSCPHPLFGPAAEQNQRRTLGGSGWFSQLKIVGCARIKLGSLKRFALLIDPLHYAGDDYRKRRYDGCSYQIRRRSKRASQGRRCADSRQGPLHR